VITLYSIILVKLFPVFFIVAVGFIYAYYSKDNLSNTTQLAMRIAMPMLAFTAAYGGEFSFEGLVQVFLFSLLLPVLTGGIVWCYLKLTGNSIPRSVYPAVMFMNAGNLCFAVIILLYGKTALMYAVVLWLLNGLWLYSIGNYILTQKLRLQNLFTNPIFVAMLLAVFLKVVRVELWEGLLVAAQWLASAALPLLLLSMGASLFKMRLAMLNMAVAGTLIRIVGGGFFGYCLIKGMGFTGEVAKGLFIISAMPAAIFSYLLAIDHKQDPEFAASIVLLSTFVSILTIPASVLLADQLL